MTIGYKDSQSAIEQNYTHLYCGCVPSSIYLNLIGSSKIQFHDILSYFTGHIGTEQTFLIHNVRMPRMLAGLVIGGALGIAGLLMQAITKNPLASPQIFGVNAGASFVIVLITVLIPALGSYSTILAIIGAFSVVLLFIRSRVLQKLLHPLNLHLQVWLFIYF